MREQSFAGVGMGECSGKSMFFRLELGLQGVSPFGDLSPVLKTLLLIMSTRCLKSLYIFIHTHLSMINQYHISSIMPDEIIDFCLAIFLYLCQLRFDLFDQLRVALILQNFLGLFQIFFCFVRVLPHTNKSQHLQSLSDVRRGRSVNFFL